MKGNSVGLSDQTYALFIKLSSQTPIPVSWCAVILPLLVPASFLVFVWPSTDYSPGLIYLEVDVKSSGVCLGLTLIGIAIPIFQAWVRFGKAVTTTW